MRDVVIAGIGGLFPNSGNLEELGKNILANEYLVQRQEYIWNRDQRVAVEPIGGRVPGHDRFDHNFFGMHGKLSLWVDPTAKLGFERSFEAIIDAGICPSSLRGSNTHVYVGTHFSDHEVGCMSFMDVSDGYAIMGHSRAMAANRLSYFFDFNGCSCVYDGGDGFGQMGLAMAVDAIASGVTDSALVVATTAISFPNICKMYKDLGILSVDELCHPFEEFAHGSHRSECCIAFLVQAADVAKRCYAKVVATDLRHFGERLRSDITAPSPSGMQRFLTDMYKENGVDPNRIAYIEADGLGHRLLDSVELDVVDAVLAKPRARPLLVGSVKSNAGHTEVASGMLGVVKCVVAMESGIIPATINHASDTALVSGLTEGRLKVVTENTPADFGEDVYVGVNTQSYNGTFGHTILKPNPKGKVPVVNPAGEMPRLVVISARSEESALHVAAKVKAYKFDPEYYRLVQDAFGPNVRGYEYRSFVICPAKPTDVVQVSRVDKRTVWFVYSGMGSQWAGMSAALMAVPVYAETMDRLHAVLERKGLDLKTIVTEKGPEAFDTIMKSFVGITACQIALTNVLTAVGFKPDGIIGHSVGELGCAYADGCLTEEQAILAAWARGRASTEAKLIKGMMAAIGLGYKDVHPRLPPGVEVACRNSDSSCTLSGPAEDVQNFVKKLSSEGVFARAVNVSDIAYHSKYIQPAAPFLHKYLKEVIQNPKLRSSKWVSTSVPEHLQDTDAAKWCSAEYQTNNLLSPVLFEEGLKHVPKTALLVEVAPHGLLQAILKRALPDNAHVSLTQRGHADPVRLLLTSLGSLTFHGAELDLAGLYPPISFPVSRGTPPVAPLATWMHDEVLYFGFKQRSVREGQAIYEVYYDSPHVSIAGSKVVTTTEELIIAWRALAYMHNKSIDELPVTFGDVHVRKRTLLPEDSSFLLTSHVSRGTGFFELENEAGTMLLTGTINPQGEEYCAPKFTRARNEVETVTLTGEEILHGLATKGLTVHDKYSALKSVEVGDKEWTITVYGQSPFAAIMEALVQVLEYRASDEALDLVLLHRWLRLDVDPIRLNKQQEIVVHYNVHSGVMSGDGLYAAGFYGTKIVGVDPPETKSPLNFKFVPYGNTQLQSVGEFLSMSVQLALEGVTAVQDRRSATRGEHNITVLELRNCSGPNVLGPAVRVLLQEKMGIKANVQTLSVVPGQKLVLPEEKIGVILTVSAPTTLTEAVRVASHVGGLVLTRSSDRLSPKAIPGMAVVAEQRVDGDWLSLLRRPEAPAQKTIVMNMASDQAPPARVSEASPDVQVILVWRGQPDAGIPGTVEEVRRRPYALYAKLVFILDEDAPKFSLAEPRYADQMRLQLQVNVLRGGTWGSWRALPLPDSTPAAISASSLGEVAIEAYGLNPRDRTATPCSGNQEWSGHLDYVGHIPTKAGQGTRVMGVARWLADRSRPRQDPLLQWKVPDDWSAAAAATVPYTYANAYYALLVSAALKRGNSILVHEGASALGQAAIRVALQHACSTIFTTVANESQRKTVRRLFPQIESRNVLSCADESFEWHIRRVTRARGVDVVLGALPGELLKASLRCVGSFGRVVHCGREDMLAARAFGMNMFLSSATVLGLAGDHLFLASERDRRIVFDAVQSGLDSGCVQPIEGAKVCSSPALLKDTLKDALQAAARDSGDDKESAKVVLSIHRPGSNRAENFKECSAEMSYVVVGGQQHDWLQVAGWLSQHGAREVLAVTDTHISSSLVRHRQRALRRLFNANLRVEEVKYWDEAAARSVLNVAQSMAPVHCVVVLVKDDGRVPTLLHSALGLHGAKAPADAPALLVLCEEASTACALAALCESRREAGLRTACVSGPINTAVEHLADLLGGTHPAVTLLDGVPRLDAHHAFDGQREAPYGAPRSVQALSDIGRYATSSRATPSSPSSKWSTPCSSPPCRVREVPSMGLRSRHAREALPVYAVAPLGVLPQQERDALAALALRLDNPVLLIESAVRDDLTDQAVSIAQAIVSSKPHGPYNVLGWGLGTPLALEVGLQLEVLGHSVVSILVDGDVRQVQRWAARQTELSLLRTAFTDDKSQELLDQLDMLDVRDRAAASAVTQLLSKSPLSESERLLAEAGFRALHTAVTAMALHAPAHAIVGEHIQGRLVVIQPDIIGSVFTRSQKVLLRTFPPQEVVEGLRSVWLAGVVMESTGYSTETREEEIRPLLALTA